MVRMQANLPSRDSVPALPGSNQAPLCAVQFRTPATVAWAAAMLLAVAGLLAYFPGMRVLGNAPRF